MKKIPVVILLSLSTSIPAFSDKVLQPSDGRPGLERKASEAFNSQKQLKLITTAGNSSNWCTRHPNSFICTDTSPDSVWLGRRPSESPFCPNDQTARYDKCFGEYNGDGMNYIGMWSDDKPDLVGIFNYSDGDKYIGQLKNGEFSGIGAYIWADGSIHYGDYDTGVASIGGLMSHIEGDTYIGGYDNDEFHGQGTFVFPDGEKIVGEFKAGNIWEGTQYSDKGKVLGTFRNGEWCEDCRDLNSGNASRLRPGTISRIDYVDGVYTGTLKNGIPDGVGVYRGPKCGDYIGQWKNGAMRGDGIFLFCDGSTFAGKFENNYPNGFGVSWSPEGWTYFGTQKDNKRHGEGIATFEDGDRYVGEYNDGVIDGQGLYASSTGKIYIGISKDGHPWNVVIYSDDSTIAGTVVDGEYCNGCSPTQPTLISRNRPDRRINGTGTGFIINKNHILTAEHVVSECNSIAVWQGHNEIPAAVISKNTQTDLAILRSEKSLGPSASLRTVPLLQMGEVAVNFGFPLYGTLSAGAIVTSGIINALSGFEDDPNQFQYDAATQFGNSGGPVLDQFGNVIGVVSAKLDDSRAQLVNFAVNSKTVTKLLVSSNISASSMTRTQVLDIPEIAQMASEFTVLVGCFD